MPRPEELPPSKTNEEIVNELELIEAGLEVLKEQIKDLKHELSKK